ncbi:MAG: response regulator transcription factor [Ferruginibacter sp.]
MESRYMNIILIDDHKLIAEGMAAMLRSYEFVKEVNIFFSLKEYLAASPEPEADIIVSDIMMPDMNGTDILVHLKSKKIKPKVIFLSSITEVQTIRYVIQNGASGYVSKDAVMEELAEALQAVYHGEKYISENLRILLIKNSFAEDGIIYHLSPREKEVLKWVCSGKTIKETAYELQLSVHTVQTYYKGILKKFKLNRTADLIVFAIQNGLYQPVQAHVAASSK